MTTTISPCDVPDAIGRSWGRWLERDRSEPEPRQYVYASAWRACDRRAVYDASIPKQAPKHDADTLARFRRGSDRERDLLVDLSRVGRDADPPFAVIEQQRRFTLRGRRGQTIIVGKIDALIEIGTMRAPLEIKAWSPFVVDRIQTFGDMFENYYARAGAYQTLGYLYGAAEPDGYVLFDQPGLPKLIHVELDRYLDQMEAFLTKAEAVTDHLARGTLPDYHDDPAECQRCPWFGRVCQPPQLARNVVKILIDPELETALERWDAGRSQARAWNDLDEDIKARLRGVEAGIVGPFAIRGAWGKTSRVVLPEALKKQYTVSDPKGRFSLDIRKV